tara:strand:- start:2006 stop:2188 length:183 start_codon:yes stop_codon:yes gene_type:complete
MQNFTGTGFTNGEIRKSISYDIEKIISSIEELIATDADNNSAKVPHLESAVGSLMDAIRA